MMVTTALTKYHRDVKFHAAREAGYQVMEQLDRLTAKLEKPKPKEIRLFPKSKE